MSKLGKILIAGAKEGVAIARGIGFTPDPAVVEVMAASGYPDFLEMNPTQQAFVQAQCGLMLYGLQQAGYKIVKE
jgi:hypothetical protein